MRVRAWAVTAVLLGGVAPFISAAAARDAAGWEVYADPASGMRVEYPAFILSQHLGAPPAGRGVVLGAADGRAQFAAYALTMKPGDTPAEYLRRNLRIPEAALHYRRVTGRFFAVSGVRDQWIYYGRCNLTGGRPGAAHCIQLMYPKQDKVAWDALVTRVSLSLR